MIAGVISVGALGVAVGHTVVSRDVQGFDCGSPLNPTEIVVDTEGGEPGLDRLRVAQCDHELDEARSARVEALIFMGVSVSIVVLTRNVGRKPTTPDDAGGDAADPADDQADSEP
jgi:hypothetical protein